MHYGRLNKLDIANGIGVRVTLFVSGCRNHCKNCFQPETWNFNYGKPYTKQTENEIIEALSQPYINGLTLLGGEPFEPENQSTVLDLILKVKEKLPQKTIWCYTGYTLEKLLQDGFHCRTEYTDKILNQIDVLIDGKFDENLKDISLKFRSYSNQRIIDMKKWRETGEISFIKE